ncbi:MAG: capsule biosynthesis protein, partial [Planktotalea sp.]
MTTKPKAKKFRIKRTGALSEGSAPEAAAKAPRPAPEAPAQPQAVGRIQPVKKAVAANAAPQRKAAEQQDAPSKAQAAPKQPKANASIEQTIDEIKREGLTGRQLRMARRAAQKYGLAPTSDYDAVRQLRGRGVDPFQRNNMLELVVPSESSGNGGSSASQPLMPQDPTLEPINLPQTMAPGGNLPAEPAGQSPTE